MDITEKQVWLIIPIIGISFTLVVLIANLVVHPALPPREGDLLTTFGVMIFLAITALAFAYLIFFPDHVFLYPVITIAHGLVNIVEGGNIIGFLMCTLGCAFALKSGFFRNHAREKFFGAFVLVIGATLSQFRYGAAVFFNSLMNIAALFLIFLMFWFLFHSYLFELLPKKLAIAEIRLGDLDLQDRDYDFIRLILNDKKYEEIAEAHLISESAVKQRMSVIYKRLGVANRTEFIVLASKTRFIFPEKISPLNGNP